MAGGLLVPLAGIEPALLAELDFESSASTSSATGAFRAQPQGRVAKPADYSGRALPVNPRVCDSLSTRQRYVRAIGRCYLVVWHDPATFPDHAPGGQCDV
jgi:hypothetical protein